ncbi:MAG: hypothetical protein AB8H03_18750 [Saprospiraceae bacterium]
MPFFNKFSTSNRLPTITKILREREQANRSKPKTFKIDHLHKWYQSGITTNRFRSAEIKKKLYQVSAFFIFVILYYGFIAIYYFNLFEFDVGVISFLIFLYSILFLVGVVAVYRMISFTSEGITSFIRNRHEKFKLLENKEEGFLKDIFSDVAKKMNIDFRRVYFWRSDSKTYLPSIVEARGGINLIFPMNFFILCIKNPKCAEALIAHEFGHVLQGDTNNWLFVESFSIGLKKFVLPVFNIFLLIQIFLLVIDLIFLISYFDQLEVGHWVSFSFNLLVAALYLKATLFLRDAPERVWKAREKSEELADAAAILYADGNALRWTLSKYAKDPYWLTVHPKKTFRMNLILEKLKRYELLDPTYK